MKLSKNFFIGPVTIGFGWFAGEEPRLFSVEILRVYPQLLSVFDITIGKLAFTVSVEMNG